MDLSRWFEIRKVSPPKDGSHFLVSDGTLFTSAHWFDGGLHLSWNKNGDDSDYGMNRVTHWRHVHQTERERVVEWLHAAKSDVLYFEEVLRSIDAPPV